MSKRTGNPLPSPPEVAHRSDKGLRDKHGNSDHLEGSTAGGVLLLLLLGAIVAGVVSLVGTIIGSFIDVLPSGAFNASTAGRALLGAAGLSGYGAVMDGRDVKRIRSMPVVSREHHELLRDLDVVLERFAGRFEEDPVLVLETHTTMLVAREKLVELMSEVETRAVALDVGSSNYRDELAPIREVQNLLSDETRQLAREVHDAEVLLDRAKQSSSDGYAERVTEELALVRGLRDDLSQDRRVRHQVLGEVEHELGQLKG